MSQTQTLKPIEEQVIVITGASSGIGLTTAKLAAARGATVVLAARSEDALRDAVDEIRAEGGQATYVVADVSEREDVREIAETAKEEFGGFDTWVNGAAVSIYGRLEDVPIEDMREQFEINVWGLLYGSIAASQHFKNRDEPGAIVNVGSIVSDRAFALQGSYSASKHAVKGFTDALRAELEEEDAPVSVTLVKPSAIDTPFPEHAKNHMDVAATLPDPIYAPETVAKTILDAAEKPEREITVGGGGKQMITLDQLAPGLLDTLMETVFYRLQRKDEPPTEEHSLDSPSEDPQQRGGYDGHVAESSLYTRLRQRRDLKGPAIAGLAATAVYAGYRAVRGRRAKRERERESESESTILGRGAGEETETEGARGLLP